MRRTAFSTILILILAAGFQAIPVCCSGSAESIPDIVDPEEYRVIAAVLVPQQPDIPDEVKGDETRTALFLALRHDHVRMDGISGERILELTNTVMRPDSVRPGQDQAMFADYYTKNQQSYRIDKLKLAAALPADHIFSMVASPEDPRVSADDFGGWEEPRKASLRRPTTSFSRPGFNKNRTKAVTEVMTVADYEMGVGYRVYLEKSSKSGAWVMTATVRTRIF